MTHSTCCLDIGGSFHPVYDQLDDHFYIGIARDADLEVAQHAVSDIVDPTMDNDVSPVCPCILHDCGRGNMCYLRDDIQFRQHSVLV